MEKPNLPGDGKPEGPSDKRGAIADAKRQINAQKSMAVEMEKPKKAK